MSLKILILPTLIILEVIIAIGYIKPNIDDILAKQIEIQTAKDGLSRVDSIIANIQTVGQSIASRAETVNFIEKYYPKKLDEERVIDMFNFFAQQSGIIVTEVNVTPEEAVQTNNTAYDDALGSGKTPEEATLMAEAAALAIPKSYRTEVTVIGDYANIKDFFSKIHHSDRLHTTEEFTIERRQEDQNKSEEEIAAGIQSSILTGMLKAKFPYMREQKTSDALNNPLFQSTVFDFKTAEQTISFATDPLPTLESSQGGRENPFE